VVVADGKKLQVNQREEVEVVRWDGDVKFERGRRFGKGKMIRVIYNII
jgi:hypothetical protein